MSVLIPYLVGIAQYGGHDGLIYDPDGLHDPKDIHQQMVGGVFVLSIPLSLLGALFMDVATASIAGLALAVLSGVLLVTTRAGGIGRGARTALAATIPVSLLLVAVWVSPFGTDLAYWIAD